MDTSIATYISGSRWEIDGQIRILGFFGDPIPGHQYYILHTHNFISEFAEV